MALAVKTVKSESHYKLLEDPDGWWDAYVKWDGCVDFKKYVNFPKGHPEHDKEFSHIASVDYIHICDLGSFIKLLQDIKAEQEKIENYDG